MQINTQLNYDYGCIEINISNTNTTSPHSIYICRISSKNQTIAELIAILDSDATFYRDYQVEQGETYWYGVSNNMNTAANNAKNSQAVIVDFEDIFLNDLEHSLRIRFNPTINSFKTIVQEQKIETIGNQFPFFFRNGTISYKELPLGGLICTEMDEWFMREGDLGSVETRPHTPAPDFQTNTSRDIYYDERKFKLQVEAWLNNGQPKVFRSPTEGCYIIRLMNVSLSPEQALSRKLHSFQATGYEIAEYNTQNLIQFHLLPVSSYSYQEI